ncbi:MAG TPA: beta-galactosidase GalA [Sphingomicrobium sp.]|jgi:beta-galactosidase|nr:beta-galactosidase GalA [Sphingomicrobium sp.]
MSEGFTRREMIGTAAVALSLAGSSANAALQLDRDAPPRRRERLSHWRFHLGHAADVEKDFGFGQDQRTFAKAGQSAPAAMPKFDDSAWASVIVPHDWAVGLPFASGPNVKGSDRGAAHGFKAIGRDFPQNSIGWYRVPIEVTASDRGRSVWLEFDGVFRDAIVFVNGYDVIRNESGYAPFRADIGDFLDYEGGPNVIAVRADATLGEGWFYEGAGIYRSVDLVRADRLHVPQWGTVVWADVRPEGALVHVATEVLNSREAAANATLSQSLIGPDGKVAALLPGVAIQLAPGEQRRFEQEVLLKAPRLWSLAERNLYHVRSEIREGDRIADQADTRFGIRSIAFDASRGFFLNGRPTKLLGTANHHDHAGVGTGIPDVLHRWRVSQLLEMGSNAWRSAHNPPSSALLDACDELGMLMICEQRINSSSPEGVSELERMVRRDRNHPSVILWSLGNEEPHQSTERGARINADLQGHVRRLDPTRPTTFAVDQGWDNGVGRVVDVLGFNYRTNQIEAYHGRHPEQPVIGTETGSTVATRGEYANDPERHLVRAYDTEHPWWATTAEEWWTIVADRPYIAGGFVWTGFDYRGEPTPFDTLPSISSQFGILDTCGFPKDNYYYYRSWWRPDQPQVHLLPHWNWPGREGQPIEIWAHGNTEEVELRLNGRSLGRKQMPRNRHLEWKAPYAPGRLEAIGYNRGRVAARDGRETSGPANAVRLTVDRRLARPGEVIIANAELTDARGRPVPTADNLLIFSAAGADIIGVGNGNPNSLEPDVASNRHAFNGFAQAIIRMGRGPVDVSVTSDGIQGSRVRIMAL